MIFLLKNFESNRDRLHRFDFFNKPQGQWHTRRLIVDTRILGRTRLLVSLAAWVLPY